MKKIFLDDMILTKALPTSAGSKMLSGYMSPFDATVVEKLTANDCEIVGKCAVGEFAIDVIGDDSAAKVIGNGEADAVVSVDVNGAPRRIAAQNGLVYVKPTYGTVSRFGTVAVACSGECVGVMADSAKACNDTLKAIVGKDERDGTMHSNEVCASALEAKEIKKVAVIRMGSECKALDSAAAELKAAGIEVTEVNAGVIALSNAAWNVLMCAELCNNLSRFDGIKYGYRSSNYKNLDELYTNSRTEAFGELVKTAILYGSDVLSAKNYDAKYDKAMRVRRVITEAFAELFKEYDAVMLPVCSKKEYDGSEDAFVENKFTAPASVTGLPAVVVGGVQLMGEAFTDGALLDLAAIITKEGK